jgi:hypothetical protein
MPSLKIICIKQKDSCDFSYLSFQVKAEKELISHRGANSLFQADFDKIEGCIYHLLDEGAVTAYDLLVRDWYDEEGKPNGLHDNIEFTDEHIDAVKEMLEQLLVASPIGQVLFTTDYQFGPKGIEKHGPMSFSEFWTLHWEGEVRMNASYLIILTA